AALTKTPVPAFLKLMDLKGVAKLASLADVLALAEDAAWLKRSGINPFALEYAMRNVHGKEFDPGLSKEKIAAFLTTTWALAKGWLVEAGTFVNEDITPEISAAYLDALKDDDHEFVNDDGVVQPKTIDFAALAYVNPLAPGSFVTPE